MEITTAMKRTPPTPNTAYTYTGSRVIAEMSGERSHRKRKGAKRGRMEEEGNEEKEI